MGTRSFFYEIQLVGRCLGSEERNSFDTEWAGFRSEVLRKLDLEFSIRLGLLASDERMEHPGNLVDRMREETASIIESRGEHIGEDLFNRARQEGVGFYTYAMYEAYRTSNRLALEVVKSARKDGRHEFIEGDLFTAIDALRKSGGHWPLS